MAEFREQKVLCGWSMGLRGAGLRANCHTSRVFSEWPGLAGLSVRSSWSQ